VSFQDRVEANVAKSAEHRKLQEQIAKERAAGEKAREDAETMKRKYDASKARTKVLEKNMRSMKEQMKILLSKSDDDDHLIDDLKKQAKHTASRLTTMMEAQNSHGSKTQLANQLKERERQLARQSQIIAKLQGQISSTKSSTVDGFKKSVQEWDFADKERQIHTLQKRNEKQAEILQLFSKSQMELKGNLSSSEKSRDELSRKIETLKRRLENRPNIKPISKDQIAVLNQKLEEKEEELQRLRTESENFSTTLSSINIVHNVDRYYDNKGKKKNINNNNGSSKHQSYAMMQHLCGSEPIKARHC